MARANRVGVIKLPKPPFESKESRKARRELGRKIKTICMWPSVKVEIRIRPSGSLNGCRRPDERVGILMELSGLCARFLVLHAVTVGMFLKRRDDSRI